MNSENKENLSNYQLLKQKPSVCSTSLHFTKLITVVQFFSRVTPFLQWFQLNFGAGNFRGRRPGTSALRMLKRLTAVKAWTHWGTCTRHGQKSRSRAEFLRNMVATRKCMAEIKQNTIEQVLAYREHVPRSGRVLESFLGYYWLCFSSMFVFEAWLIQCSILRRLEIQCLHPKQIFIRHSRLYKQISQVPRSLFGQFHLRCWFLRPANCLQKQFRSSSANKFYRKQRYQMSRKRLICVDPRTTRRILGQKLAFFSKFRHVWYQKKPMKPSLLSLSRAGEKDDHCPFSQRANYKFMYGPSATPSARRMTPWCPPWSFVFLCRSVREDCHPLKKYGKILWCGENYYPMKMWLGKSSEYSLIPRESK